MTTNPEHRKFVKWWCDKFKELFGVPYAFNGGKDGENVKRLLDVYGMDLLCRMSMALFRITDDPFIVGVEGMGYTIAALKTKSNQLAVAVSDKKAAPPKSPGEIYIKLEQAEQRKKGLRE